MTKLWRDDIDPENLPLKVMIERDTLIDKARNNRPVKIKVYYPVSNSDTRASAASDASNKLPLILWSHGLGGSVDGAAFISRFLAGHGFVILHVQHHGTDSSLWEGKPGHPWDIIRAQKINRAATLNRFIDIPFALDQFPVWLENNPQIQNITDLNTIGMSGHSFGSLTTQVVGGMMFPDEKGVLRRNRETRLKAGILYSPGPIDHLGLDVPEDIYGSIDLPMFHITGTDDSSPIEDWDYTKRLDVYNNIIQAKQHLLVINNADHMVFNGSRGKLGQNPYREKHEAIIQVAVLAYWEATLKNNQDAQDWLNDGGFKNWLSEEGSFK